MKIALLQLNFTIGDISGNAAKIFDAAMRAGQMGADLCVTSELALTGYPPRDLLFNNSFVRDAGDQAKALALRLAEGPALLLGLPLPNDTGQGRPLLNSAILLQDGRITARFNKSLLPTYDVFDEDRYFQPEAEPGVFELAGRRFGVTVCEDLWNDKDFWRRRKYSTDPVEMLKAKGVDVILNLSASPFCLGKQEFRQDMIAGTAKKYALPVLVANQVGGNDDLIFDGRSSTFDSRGDLFARGDGFAEDLVLADLDDRSGKIAEDDFSRPAETYQALVLGTGDYVRKCGFTGALVGLSGGIDSGVTATVAAHALGPENVLGVLMPSPYSSTGSIEDSKALAENLGIDVVVLPVSGIMESFDRALENIFAGLPKDVTEENIQARIRGNLLMALSNKFGKMVLTTGNKSELAVGYCTIYGDMTGGLGVIADVPKTQVYELARWINQAKGQTIPEAILEKPPSAELRPGQKDTDSLPPYDLLDRILELHIQAHQSAEEIAAQGFDRAVVEKIIRLVRIAEFKRRQAAPGLKITDRAFGVGWRMPIAAKPDF